MSTLSISELLTSEVLEANHRGIIYPPGRSSLQNMSKTFTIKGFATPSAVALGFGLASNRAATTFLR